MPERYLTAGEVAQCLRVSLRSVYRAIHSGRLPAVRRHAHGHFLVRESDLEAFLRPAAATPPERPPGVAARAQAARERLQKAGYRV